MEQKHFIIGGIVLLVVILIAGIVFTPSGFVIKPGGTQGLTCVELGTNIVCGGASDSDYWKENTFGSKDLCDDARDEYSKPCAIYGCTCKYVPE